MLLVIAPPFPMHFSARVASIRAVPDDDLQRLRQQIEELRRETKHDLEITVFIAPLSLRSARLSAIGY
jgi:hypothetical protein